MAKWTGSERVLDVGCGRGLMMITAAARLTDGRAYGIDLWRTEDLSGNSEDSLRENARRLGVSDKIEVSTGDMRNMPYADQTFHIVVSMAAIHNLSTRSDRSAAIREMVRVTDKSGIIIIDDIRHVSEYRDELRRSGMTADLKMHPLALLLSLTTFGSLKPGTVRATRPMLTIA